jgi:hypothetical protein
MLTQSILAKVEPGRLQKAVEGLVSGAYTISVTGQSEAEVSGFVANGDGKQYGVVLTENNVRTGFFEYEEFLAVREALPSFLQPVAIFGYYTGWRVTEILNLQWRQVNLEAGEVRLDPGTTKTGSCWRR